MSKDETVEVRQYDKRNVFCKILNEEIKCKKVIINGKIMENECAMSFYDINPRKTVHVLVIPRGEYIDLQDFYSRASKNEVSGFFGLVAEIVKYCEDGKIESNFGVYQDVRHLHVHVIAERWVNEC